MTPARLLGDVKVNVIVVLTFSWRKGRCTRAQSEVHQRNICDMGLPVEACFGLGDVKVEMKRRMKTFSWRKDLKLNASQCFSGAHATVRFHQRNIRDKRSCQGVVKVEKRAF